MILKGISKVCVIVPADCPHRLWLGFFERALHRIEEVHAKHQTIAMRILRRVLTRRHVARATGEVHGEGVRIGFLEKAAGNADRIAGDHLPAVRDLRMAGVEV